jgi:hypothetical protein
MLPEILKPVVVLIAWTLVMMLWMLFTRLPAMRAAGVDLNTLVGSKPADAERLPPNVQWKAHNYNHLHEQPTLFYAVALVLAMIGQGDGLNATLAWGYVGFRIAHSLVQATVNRVSLRFALFALASLCLIALTVHAAISVFHG